MRIIAQVRQVHLLRKDFADLLPILVQSRDDNMRGMIMTQLQYQLSQVCLVDVDVLCGQIWIQVNL